MTAVVLALASSLSYGVSDFLGGQQSRVKPERAVLLVSQATGLVLVVLLVVVTGASAPAGRYLAYGVLAGLAEAVAVASLYRGLATGAMAVVAPLAATAPVVAVAVALASGDTLAGGQVTGIALCVLGVVWLARADGSPAASGRAGGARWGLLAAAGLGAYLVLLEAASRGGVPWALLMARATTVAVFAGVTLATARRRLGVTLRGAAPLALIGALILLGDGLYAAATTRGELAVVAVLGSLYPVVTVALAAARLGERPSRGQITGGAVALTGAVILALS